MDPAGANIPTPLSPIRVILIRGASKAACCDDDASTWYRAYSEWMAMEEKTRMNKHSQERESKDKMKESTRVCKYKKRIPNRWPSIARQCRDGRVAARKTMQSAHPAHVKLGEETCKHKNQGGTERKLMKHEPQNISREVYLKLSF